MQETMLLNFIDSGLYFYTYFKQKKDIRPDAIK